MICEEVIDEEDEHQYQRMVGFLPADGEADLEEIVIAKTLEVADSEIDPFAGLYHLNSNTDHAEAALEDINIAKTLEVADPEIDLFAGLYHMDSNTDDGDAALEDVNIVKILEVGDSEMVPFAGLYHMDSDTDDTDTDNEFNIDVRVQVVHGNRGFQS